MDAAARKPRLFAMLTVVAGIATLVVTIVFNLLPQVTTAGACLPPDAMVRFEFARSGADIPFLFGACQARSVEALDAINRLDLTGYIPSYNAFGILAAIFLGRRALVWWVAGAAVTIMVTLTADFVETLTLLRITKDLAAAGPLYAVSSTAAWIKFSALALNSGFLAVSAWRASPRRPILAVLLILPVLATVAMALDRSLTSLLTYAYLLGWTPVLLVAMRDAASGEPEPTKAIA